MSTSRTQRPNTSAPATQPTSSWKGSRAGEVSPRTRLPFFPLGEFLCEMRGTQHINGVNGRTFHMQAKVIVVLSAPEGSPVRPGSVYTSIAKLNPQWPDIFFGTVKANVLALNPEIDADDPDAVTDYLDRLETPEGQKEIQKKIVHVSVSPTKTKKGETIDVAAFMAPTDEQVDTVMLLDEGEEGE